MTTRARTLHYDKNLILVTTEGAESVSIDEQFFDFSYALEPKKFLGNPAVRSKFTELYKAEQELSHKYLLSYRAISLYLLSSLLSALVECQPPPFPVCT